MLAPDCRVDEVLALYLTSRPFSGYLPETKRNYINDLCLYLNYLREHGRSWTQATSGDIEDYEYWRRDAPSNPRRVTGAKWNRDLAAIDSLYKWAARPSNGFVAYNPVGVVMVRGRAGAMIPTKELSAKDAKYSDVHWLTPRAFRRWVGVGLRGHDRGGVPSPGWVGRLEDRNLAYTQLLYSSGLRRLEGASLLTIEVPRTRLEGGLYYVGRLAKAVTRSKKPRTFYVSAEVVGQIESYMESSRAEAVRKAQAAGRYTALPQMRLVERISLGPRKTVHWRNRDGMAGQTVLNAATAKERATYFTEGPRGPEPLWLWLNESGLPFDPHSWEGVFMAANVRCRAILAPGGDGLVSLAPGLVEAPYLTPHGCRHSFALYMLVILHHLMDERFGLTPEERRDYQLLYGDPWRMVQDLLGHAQLETTRDTYLAPVADLQLRSLLATAPTEGGASKALDGVFARLAREAEGIQDIDDRMTVAS
ncbi:MAG TPA: site-specific integrase [Solirubrobacteraceae bacterium]